MPTTSKYGVNYEMIMRDTTAPGTPWGSFPMNVVNWEGKDMFRDFFFSENDSQNCALKTLFASPIHINHNNVYYE